MSEIVPAILEETPEAFANKLAIISKLPELKKIQVDFSDGIFTPRKTVLPTDLDSLSPILQWEAHLMVKDPQEYFFDCKLIGFGVVVIHYESIEDKNVFKSIAEEIRGLKMSPGLAIKPGTSLEDIDSVVELFDQVLILGVNPGFQGQEMDAGVIGKVKKLKNTHKNVIIEVDGGVKLSNISSLLEAGTDLFVVGSALFDLGDTNQSPSQNFESFIKKLSETKQNGSAINNPTTST